MRKLKGVMLGLLIGSVVFSVPQSVKAVEKEAKQNDVSWVVKRGQVPNCMQPDSVIIYDEDLNYSFESGGELFDAQKQNSGVYARTGMMAVYDKNGVLRNVYYEKE